MSRLLGPAVPRWLPVALALVAEAAVLAVVAGLLQAIVLLPPSPGIPALVVAAAAGLVAARRLGPRLGDRWPGVAVALATACGVAGWLLSPEVWSILAARGLAGIGPALAAHPGGWLAWPAFVRGMAYARLPLEPRRVATLLGVGVPVIGTCAILGGMLGQPTRGLLLASIQADAVVFLVTGVPALALARLAGQAPGTDLDWRRNPPWLALVVGLLVLAVGSALLLAAVAGQVVATAVSALFVPLLLVGFIAGFDRRSLRILALSVLAAGAIGVFLGLFEDIGREGGAVGPVAPSTPQEPAAQAGLAIGALVVILAIAVIVVAVLARLWLRRPTGVAQVDDEVREIAHDDETDRVGAHRRARRGRRRAPVDAVSAYRMLIEDLASQPVVAREASETPAEHARRLRQAGAGSLGLELLAADYGLVRFGGVELSAAEHRRAIARAETVRRRARAFVRASGLAAGAAGTGDAAQAGGPGRSTGPVVRGRGRLGGAGADLPDVDQPGVAETLLNRIRRGP